MTTITLVLSPRVLVKAILGVKGGQQRDDKHGSAGCARSRAR